MLRYTIYNNNYNIMYGVILEHPNMSNASVSQLKHHLSKFVEVRTSNHLDMTIIWHLLQK